MISSLRLVEFVFLCLTLAPMLYITSAEELLPCETDGEFFHNTENCNTYYRCVHGQKTLMPPCPAGSVFSLQVTTCVPKGTKDLDDCVEVTVDPIEEQCNNGASIIPHPTKCHQYYNCSLPQPVFNSHMGPIHRYLDECMYSQYFSTDTLQCEDPGNVDCGDREEFLDACSYMRFQCLGTSHCMPCAIGSCICRDDGQNPNDKRMWTPQYTVCENERAVRDPATELLGWTCPRDDDDITQIFHPLRKMCVPLYLIPREHDGNMPLCSEKTNGNYYDSYYGCHGYTVCIGGLSNRIEVCAVGEVFDTVRQQCWIENEACGECGAVSQEDCDVNS